MRPYAIAVQLTDDEKRALANPKMATAVAAATKAAALAAAVFVDAVDADPHNEALSGADVASAILNNVTSLLAQQK